MEMPKDYIMDWSNSILQQANLKSKFNESTPEFEALSSSSLKLIFGICQKFHFDAETEFTAYCTFDKFVSNLFMEELNKRKREKFNPRTRLCRWKKFLKSLEKQVLMKTMNVIMISQKFVNRQIAIPIDDILGMLYESKLPCSFEELKRSENEVFKVLNFQPASCNLSSVVTFLAHTIYQSQYPEHEQIILECCNLLIRYVYLERRLLMNKYKTKFQCDLKTTDIAAAIILMVLQFVSFEFDFKNTQWKLILILSIDMKHLNFIYNEFKSNIENL